MTNRLLPNWIEAYMAYTAESESPDEFHAWTALVTIAGALRRKVFFDMGYFMMYPNLYVVLVSPAGRCKKSTAMRIGRRLLAQVPGINFSTDSVTRERLIQDLTQSHVDGHSSMTAYSSEFASLLTSSGMDMVVFLTDIYDSPEEWIHKTKLGGTNKIKAPYLNLEGGTTPDWIARSLPLDTVGIGLTSRVLFVYQDTPRVRKPFPELSKEQVELGQILLRDLQTISVLQGQYRLEAKAKLYYEDWYLKRHEDNPTPDPRLAGYYERKPMHCLKVAICLAAAESDDLILTVAHLDKGLALLKQIEERMVKVFANVGKNPLSNDISVVAEMISINGEMTYGEIMTNVKHSVRKDELDEVLDMLVFMGQIRRAQSEKGAIYVSLDK